MIELATKLAPLAFGAAAAPATGGASLLAPLITGGFSLGEAGLQGGMQGMQAQKERERQKDQDIIATRMSQGQAGLERAKLEQNALAQIMKAF